MRDEFSGKDGVTVERICRVIGKSRQVFYKQRKAREAQSIDEAIILDLVKRERQLMPRLGARKLMVRLRWGLEDAGIKIGRDRFLKLLKRNDLLVPKLKAFSPKTTYFDPALRISLNLVGNLTVEHVNQVWVADITYIRIQGGFCYLCLIMDKYSRKIVGWHVGETLETTDTLVALEMAVKTLVPGELLPIHHSDRGSQYASRRYRKALTTAGLVSSMTEVLHCYENAHAERLNGILKYEFGLDCTFTNIEQARKATKQAVAVYNSCRPHESLGYKTPQEMYEAA